MIEVRMATSAAELEAIYRFRYSVYVEEMGRYHATADHAHRRLVDPEDTNSFNFYAVDDDRVVASNRVTWGENGFSARQIEQYGLRPFLEELPTRVLFVGERTMVAAAARGTTVGYDLANGMELPVPDGDLLVTFGAFEPHLISYYAQLGQVPYAARNINSEESGYLVPNVSFPQGLDALRGITGDVDALPRCIQRIVDGPCAVKSSVLMERCAYRRELAPALGARGGTLFDGCDDGEIDRCLERSSIMECAVGDRVIKSGGTARNLFVVVEGALEARDGSVVVGALGPGDAVGETAFLLQQPRSLDVYVTEPGTKLLVLSERVLQRALATDAQLAAKLLMNLAKLLCRRQSSPIAVMDGSKESR